MNAERLLAHYEQIADAPDAIARLRRFILDLAVRGKLVPQDATDEPASEPLKRIAKEKIDQADLPKGWRRTRVGALLDFQYGKGLKASERADEGPVPVFGSNGIVGFTDEPLTARPSIIVGRKGSAGALNLCDGPSWTTDVAYFVEAPSFLDLRFLFNALAALDLEKLSKGVKPGLSRSGAYEQVLCVPPLAEQQRIVAKVDDLMALCDRLEAARAEREVTRDQLAAASLARVNAPDPDTFQKDARFALDALPALTTRPDQIKQLRQTILNLAVRGKLVPQDPSDEPASELLKRVLAQPWKKKRKLSELVPNEDAVAVAFSLPLGWAWATVDLLVRPDETVTYGILKPEWVKNGVPTVRVTEMKTGEIDVASLPQCDPTRASKFQKTTLVPGDLLISKDGTIGKTAFVPPELAGGNITQHMLRFPITDGVCRQFIRLAIDAPFCQSWMVGETKGVALQGVNVGDFRRMPIPLPPLAEQQRIVIKVDALMALSDRLEASLTTAADTRRRLLDALLADALAPEEARELEAAE